MKLDEIVEDFCLWLKHKKPGVITGLMWVGVWIAGGIYIVYHGIKDLYERRVCGNGRKRRKSD